ncbi:MAG: glycosyltransferase [Candidatus Omnitrophica bacterium]|nr:glycosyltransferase [Candidatus Omnitrophota bacterium]MDD5429323.1 glycosyltransferase [Candidatus Omnitrophota bacterium]
MLKVLMFNKLYHPCIGGVERSVYGLCEEIKGQVELTILAANTKFRTEVECKHGCKIIRAASLGNILSSVHLGVGIPLCWQRLSYDIIHFNFPSPVAEIYCLALLPKDKPLVVTYHADIVGHKRAMAFYRPFLIRFLKRANRIIATSPYIIEHSPFLSMFKDKCVVIPLGIKTEKFKLTDKIKDRSEEIKKQYEGPIILFVGRLVEYKGVDYLIRAMEKINASLLVVGEGPQGKKLRFLGERINSDKKKVFFVGRTSEKDLAAYYYASSVVVLPSVGANEAFGITQLEAHCCSKPVVSTDLPTGVPFVNLDGITGLVVPPKSSQALANAINTLLEDADLCSRLGKQGKERVESQFTMKGMAQKVISLYKDFS